MEYKKSNKLVFLFIALWIGINSLQAILTPLHYDEAYYWVWSRALDWGYFDHPSLVALFIHLGSQLFSNELGVRIVSIGSTTVGLCMLFRIISNVQPSKRFDLKKYILILLCFPFLQIYGFISTPDVPLLLGSIWIIYQYQAFLQKANWLNMILLGLAMGFVLHGKYHGAIVILGILISNPKLLLNYKIYIIGIIGLLVWSPHIWWQYQHDFVSFRFHLSERLEVHHWYDPFIYLAQLLLVFPIVFIPRYKPIFGRLSRDPFLRAMTVIMYLFVLIFGLKSFSSAVQAQWTLVAMIPFIILLCSTRPLSKKYIYRIGVFHMLLYISARIFLMSGMADLAGFGQPTNYIATINKDAEKRPVMYYSSYRRAALHSWYTAGRPYVHSYNGYAGRLNQYNLWDLDSIFHGKTVYLVGSYSPIKDGNSYENYFGGPVQYFDYDRVKCIIEDAIIEEHDKQNWTLHLDMNLTNPYDHVIDFEEPDNELSITFYDASQHVTGIHRLQIDSLELIPNQTVPLKLSQNFNNLAKPKHISLTFRKSPNLFGPKYNTIHMTK